MSKYTPEACARAGIPYDPEWREVTPERGYSRMQFWETVHQNVLLAEEPVHARREREFYEHAYARSLVAIRKQDGAGMHLTPEYWRHEWRSMPDYEGPPMRAPSGPAFEFFDCTGTPSQEFSTITNTSPVWLRERITDAQAQAYAELLQHFAAMARRGECEFVGFGLLDMTPKDAYTNPSLGGRGWCPKLARVGE